LASWGSSGSASTMMDSFVMALRQTAGHFTIIAVGAASKSRFRKLKPPPNQLLNSLEFDTVDRVTSNFNDFLSRLCAAEGLHVATRSQILEELSLVRSG
jgi:hypothetical protein